MTYSSQGTYNYLSIVEALRAQIERETGKPAKEYSYDYKGITQAIQDLTITAESGPAAEIGPQPGGGNVVIDDSGDPQWIVNTEPDNGSLWFDTRQGRLFIAYENEWYQTNGGDGLPVVTSDPTAPAASNLAIGQFWWDASTNDLYIFEGTYENADGSITTVPNATNTPIWIKITLAQGDYFQNTKTLPVEGTSFQEAVQTALDLPDTNFPFVDPATIVNQQNANAYLLDTLTAFNTVLNNQAVYINSSPPANPVEGQLWFDIDEIEISMFYNDGATSQWVPIFSALMYDDDLNAIKAAITTETTKRTSALSALTTTVEAIETADLTRDSTLISLQGQINNMSPANMSLYQTIADHTVAHSNLEKQIASNDSDIAAIYLGYYNKNQVLEIRDNLQADINNRVTSAQLTAVQNSIPSVSGLASTAYVDSKVAAVPAGLASGGKLTGSVVVDKNTLGQYTFNASTHYWDGSKFMYFKTKTTDGAAAYSTFGTNENDFEYSWDFSSNEDYCWTHGTNGKVASIDKNGIAAEQITIGTFGVNGANGRVLTNTIDVGAKLTAYQAAFEAMRSGITTSTDYDSLKANLLTALASI